MTQVVPAIIPHTFEQLSRDVERVKDYASLVQIDVVDGAYAPVTTWPFNEDHDGSFEQLVSGELALPHAELVRFEVDLMVNAPDVLLDSWIAAGFSHLIVHVESTEDLKTIIARLRMAGRGIGLALRPSTPNEVIEPWVSQVDFVQFMGNDSIGRHGVALDERVIEKVRALRSAFPAAVIAVDIGVNSNTAPALVEAGVNKLVSGSAIFNSDEPQRVMAELKAA